MNLLLLLPEELGEMGEATIRGRRAEHLLRVLKVDPGDRVRAGVRDGALGTALVLDVTHDSVRVRCFFDEPAPPADDVLLLAMPRPKVLLRCLEHATALGFGRILIFRTHRVVKSHLESHALEPSHYQARLYAGLEQSRRTRFPEVRICSRFLPFIEEIVPRFATPGHRFVAHPDAATATWEATLSRRSLTLAIGPEGGFIPYEIERLEAAGFFAVHAGPHPLRVEAALSFISGQLMARRETAPEASLDPDFTVEPDPRGLQASATGEPR